MAPLANLLFVVVLATSSSAIRIGSFNLHQYGAKKSVETLVNNQIAQLINEFDLAIIQEISDVSLKAPFVLHDTLNTYSKTHPYTMALSDRVGRSATKEQFIFFNRAATSGLDLINTYVYNDTRTDYFERPPFLGTFKVKKPGRSGVKLFTIMNLHLRPDDAYTELLAMRHVINDFIHRHPQYFDQTATSYRDALKQNVINGTLDHKPSLKTAHPIIIVGDLNADCSYISLKRQESLRSIDFADFTWIINNEVKTNTRQTCTYDRILINGDNFIHAIVPHSNMTVNFREKFQLTASQALDISDHFPIKFDINW